MLFVVADDDRDAAVGLHDASLGHRLDRVVGALAVHFRLEKEQQTLDGRIVKDDDVIDRVERRKNLSTLDGRHDWALWSLQRRHRGVIVHCHDQAIGVRGRTAQMAHVPDVQEIEASVGESDPASRLPVARKCFDEFWFRENLPQLRASFWFWVCSSGA
jgi:hypothetical protein